MVSPSYVARLIQIESGGNPNAVTGRNRGLGQFSPDLERQYGITDANRNSVDAQTAAVQAEASAHGPQLAKVLGRAPTDAELYLAHQQGLGGATAHLTAPDAPAWQNMAGTGEGQQKGADWAKAAIWGNMTPQMKAQFPGGVDSVTSADFTRLWADRFGGAPQTAADASAAPAASPMGLLPQTNPGPSLGLLAGLSGQQQQQPSGMLNLASLGQAMMAGPQMPVPKMDLLAPPEPRQVDLSRLRAMLQNG